MTSELSEIGPFSIKEHEAIFIIINITYIMQLLGAEIVLFFPREDDCSKIIHELL